jgi:hypothetical protein
MLEYGSGENEKVRFRTTPALPLPLTVFCLPFPCRIPFDSASKQGDFLTQAAQNFLKSEQCMKATEHSKSLDDILGGPEEEVGAWARADGFSKLSS